MERAGAPATANAEDARELCARLSAFNRASSGFDFEDVPVRLAWRDEQGELRGGLLADVCAGWLQVHVLWVDPERRGRGIGQRLLADAETQARDAGACGVMLDTFDWQAEHFYLRQGYEVFGRLPDCPPGHERIYLRKVLPVL